MLKEVDPYSRHPILTEMDTTYSDAIRVTVVAVAVISSLGCVMGTSAITALVIYLDSENLESALSTLILGAMAAVALLLSSLFCIVRFKEHIF